MGSLRSSTVGSATCRGSTLDTSSWTRRSDSKRDPYQALRGNRKTQPSAVRKTSNSKPEPRRSSVRESTFGKLAPIAIRAPSGVSSRSASQGGELIGRSSQRKTSCSSHSSPSQRRNGIEPTHPGAPSISGPRQFHSEQGPDPFQPAEDILIEEETDTEGPGEEKTQLPVRRQG